jgi:hypothetical protein
MWNGRSILSDPDEPDDGDEPIDEEPTLGARVIIAVVVAAAAAGATALTTWGLDELRAWLRPEPVEPPAGDE